MKDAIRDPEELIQTLRLPASHVESALRAASGFRLFAPREFVAKMRPGDVDDPLLRQVLPVGEELENSVGYTSDPVGDLASTAAPGLLHKYHGRALLIVTGACPVHCRYCFRRHFPYSDGPRNIQEFAPALQAIADDKSISEIIFSGGDPLTVVDDALASLAEDLSGIPHLRRIRIHTRMPIMIPQRVTSELLDWLTGTHLTPVVVVHANHPREIDSVVGDALRRIVDAGATVLNQSVLLAGVNDKAEVLIELSQRLIDYGVMPYYLHALDRVAGAAHFEVPQEKGLAIIEEMRAQLPGYLVPRYVRESAGEAGKSVLA